MLRFIATLALVAYASAIPAVERINVNSDLGSEGCNNAPDGAFPSIVSIRTSAGIHFCSGTILNADNILTAAQCVIGRSAANIDVLAGTNILDYRGITRGAGRFIIHPNLNQNTLANDIAVIRLRAPLEMGDNVRPVSLNRANTDSVAGILVGWGRTSSPGVTPNNRLLQQLNTRILTQAECQQSWGNTVSALGICVVVERGCGVCDGDPGGPLYQASNGAQLGVVSFGRVGGCAVGRPDVHIRVSSYINWILSAIDS